MRASSPLDALKHLMPSTLLRLRVSRGHAFSLSWLKGYEPTKPHNPTARVMSLSWLINPCC